MYKNIFLVITLLLLVQQGYAQPANNNPCTATALPTNASCVNVSGTNVAATGSVGVPAPGCASYSGGDVWYSIVVPAGGAIDVETSTNGGFTDGGMALYTGTCGSLTLVECDDDDGAGTMSLISATGLIAGSTVFVRVWEFGNNATGTFAICATAPVVVGAPANDNPCTATALPVNGTCINSSGTNVGATGSVGVPAPGCASYSGGDIWYSIVVPAGGAIDVETSTNGGFTDGGMALYTGTCGSLTLVECDDDDGADGAMSLISATGLIAGSTVFVRVWEFGNNATGTFAICATAAAVVVPATNDNCIGATSLTQEPMGSCSPTAGDVNNGATNSGVAASCFGTPHDDLWYSFVANNVGAVIERNANFDSEIEIFDACAGTSIGCQDAETDIILSGLTIGNTYYIRIYSYSATSPIDGTFDICITTPPPPPGNDDCVNAISLTHEAGGTCTATMATVASASNSGVAPSCSGTPNDDVWFSFVATDDTANIVRNANFDSEVEILDGCAGTSLGCQDTETQFQVVGLTIGNTYYVRVYSYSATLPADGTFDICVTAPAPAATNGLCNAMDPICTSSGLYFTGEVTGVDADVADPGNDYDCLLTTPNPTWYYLQVDDSGDIDMSLTAGSDIDYIIWGPFPNLATAQGSCGSLTTVADCSYDPSSTETPSITGAVTGEVYVMMITNFAGVVQPVTLTQTGGLGSTDCTILVPCNADAGGW